MNLRNLILNLILIPVLTACNGGGGGGGGGGSVESERGSSNKNGFLKI